MTPGPKWTLYDAEAEEGLVGRTMFGAAAEEIFAEVDPEHFYVPGWRRAFIAARELFEAGIAPDPEAVAARLRTADPEATPTAVELLDALISSGSGWRELARIVAHWYAMRQVAGIATSLMAVAEGAPARAQGRSLAEIEVVGDNPYQVAEAAAKALSEVGMAPGSWPRGASSFADLVANAQQREMGDWLIPGLMGQGWRTIIVAPEGQGKGVLLRQLAIALAAGMHPLMPNYPITPRPTLIVDLENPTEAIAETGGRMIAMAETMDWTSADCQILHEPAGMDLRSWSQRSGLVRMIDVHRPALVCIGPLYKMYRRRDQRESDEDIAIEVAQVLDQLRARYGFALVIEHHVPKGQGARSRSTPFGSSVWMRWPELGLGLKPRKVAKDEPPRWDINHWRGERIKANWPTGLERGGAGSWPWVGIWPRTPLAPNGLWSAGPEVQVVELF